MVSLNEKSIKPLDGHDSKLEETIFNKYREIRKRNKKICDECQQKEKILNDGHPVSFFVVGENFRKEKYRVMFVGKTVQSGWEEDEPIDRDSGFIDARIYGYKLFLPFWGTAGLFPCIKEVCRKLWKINDAEKLWEKIIITNIVKCSISESGDQPSKILHENCILKARFFETEVRITEPTHIIFFTYTGYDDYIGSLRFGYSIKDKNLDYKKKLPEEKGKIIWWHRQFLDKGKVKIHFLRTYHPGYFKKQQEQEQFANEIAKWIKKNPTTAMAG